MRFEPIDPKDMNGKPLLARNPDFELVPAEGRSFLVRQSQNAVGNHVSLSLSSERPCVTPVSEFTLLGGRIWARIDRETSLVYLWTSPKKWCRMLESMRTVQNPQVKIRIFEKNPAKKLSWTQNPIFRNRFLCILCDPRAPRGVPRSDLEF